MSTLGERIRAVRKVQKPKMNQDEFAKSLGATRRMQATYEGEALFKKFCKRDFCDEVRDFKIPEPEAVAS